MADEKNYSENYFEVGGPSARFAVYLCFLRRRCTQLQCTAHWSLAGDFEHLALPLSSLSGKDCRGQGTGHPVMRVLGSGGDYVGVRNFPRGGGSGSNEDLVSLPLPSGCRVLHLL
jgi:hypothetical protein